MAFCESQWFGGGVAYGAASTSSGIMWYGNGSTTSVTAYTGINCWTTSSSGGGTCIPAEYYNSYNGQVQVTDTQIQMLQMQQMQMMQVHAEHLYAAQGRQGFNQLTDEQRRAQQAQAEDLQQARLEQLKLQTEAGTKAKELLLEHLTPAQKETFNKNNWFVVEGGKSKQQYRIQARTHSINIEVLDGKKVSHRLCAHLHYSAGAPLHDHILAQKIMLEYAEDDFLKIANRHAA